MDFQAVVLCKDEIANIQQCLEALGHLGLDPLILDSGSRDGTVAFAKRNGARVIPYDYKDHCSAYNEITSKEPSDVGCVILDADMRVSPTLWREARRSLELGADVVRAPVRLFWAGRPLRFSSMYPPKPFVFRGGESYFRPLGHGEALVDGVEVVDVEPKLVHDDRKPFSCRLATQEKYARQLASRIRSGEGRLRDLLRLYTPISTFLIMPYILLGKFGLLDGKVGVLYALERLLAEALIWREGLCRIIEP